MKIPDALIPGAVAWIAIEPADESVRKLAGSVMKDRLPASSMPRRELGSGIPYLDPVQLGAARIIWKQAASAWLEHRADASCVVWAIKGPTGYGVAGMMKQARDKGWTAVSVEAVPVSGLTRLAQVIHLALSRNIDAIVNTPHLILADDEISKKTAGVP